MPTMREHFILALTALHHERLPSTKHYDVFVALPPHSDMRLYVGRAGALRIGRNVTSSVPASPQFRDKLLRAHEGLLFLGRAAVDMRR